MNLKFLIVLVYYKRPQIVLNALQSIKELSYDNWQLDFIDDSGDDAFKETLMNFGLDNSKVNYIASYDSEETKRSIGGSRHGHFMNESIKNSDSDIIVILCDDDAIVNRSFEYLNEYYQLNPEVNWAYSKVYFYDPTKESYLDGKTEDQLTYRHHGSTYTLNQYSDPLIPMGKIDGSQITFRSKVFKEGNLWYPSPQTRNLDASIFEQIIQKYGYCYPTFIYGQYKGAFADQLGNRWTDNHDEFNITNK
jgi:glycosyltransferase involved in cell wall biosynthesis